MTATLKKSTGEAGAFLDESNARDSRLYDVLKEMAYDGAPLSAYQATIAVAVIAGMVIRHACKLRELKIAVGTTGTAGSTTVAVLVNGVSKGTLTVANTEADGTVTSTDLDVALAEDDVVTLSVTAAPTGGAALTATAHMGGVTVE